MKLIRFVIPNSYHAYGKLEAERVYEFSEPGNDWCGEGFKENGRCFELSSVRLLAPCLPSKVICLGLNYRSHAEEMKFELPKKPILFLKPSTAVIGSGETIVYPSQSRQVDYEAELGVVMGRRTYRVNRAEALNYVFGYTCANDVTARDKQPKDGQWTYAKGFDTFCPLGPVIETAIDDPEDLLLQGFRNGELVQKSSTADHYFPVAEVIEFVSGCMTLLPGDVILTGTPAGIGELKLGDKFTVTIDKIGSLHNEVGAAE